MLHQTRQQTVPRVMQPYLRAMSHPCHRLQKAYTILQVWAPLTTESHSGCPEDNRMQRALGVAPRGRSMAIHQVFLHG